MNAMPRNTNAGDGKWPRLVPRIAVMVFTLLAPVTFLFGGEKANEPLKAANTLFAQGHFEAARKQYATVLNSSPDNCEVIERLGFISFLTGRYADSLARFKRVAVLDPAKAEMMDKYSAFSYYLLGDYSACAEILKRRGSVDFLNSAQVEYFVKHPPYQLSGKVDKTVIPFVKSDPLPVVEIEINSNKVFAFLDSGQPQIFVDTDFAKRHDIRAISEQVLDGFVGGKEAAVSFASVQSLKLGDITVREVPAWLVGTHAKAYSKAFGVTIDAIIGTELLMQFLPTLDYPGGQLILRVKNRRNAREVEVMKGVSRTSFVKDGIHFMYSQCYLNGKGPTMMYFDSGLGDAKGASVLMVRGFNDFGFPEPKGKVAIQGGGGVANLGGYFTIDELRVGDIVCTNQKAIYHGGEGKLFSCPGYEPKGLIGHNFLKQFKWTIDFDNRLFLFGK